MAETSPIALTSTSSSLHTHTHTQTLDQSDETLYQLEVQLQLEQIIYRITHSRNALIRIVNHLLVELRADQSSSTSSRDTAQSQVQIPTLADLTTQYINPEVGTGKRKRQMTHYQGIPLCIIHPCTSTSTSTYSTSLLEFGLTRPIRSPKRSGTGNQFKHVDSRKLHDQLNFQFLRIDHGHDIGNTSARSSRSFVSSSSSSSSAQTTNSDNAPNINDNDNDNDNYHSDDTDSDDEEDVVLILHS